jgi:hypothetical protein
MERWQRQCAHIAPVVEKRCAQEQHQKDEQLRSARERRQVDLQREHDRRKQKLEEQLYQFRIFGLADEDGGRAEAMTDDVRSSTEKLAEVIGQTSAEVNQNEDTPSGVASTSVHGNQPPADTGVSQQKQRLSVRSHMAWIFGRSTAELSDSADQLNKDVARVRDMRALRYGLMHMQQRQLGDIDTTVNKQIEPTDDSVPAKQFASARWILTNAKVILIWYKLIS